MSDAYYGIYLIPPSPIVYALSLGHQVMRAEYNTHIAGKFMVHCTIKGFTKLAPLASPTGLITALDELLARTPAFQTEIGPPRSTDSGPGAGSELLWLRKGEAFQQLHNDVWALVEPHVASDCLFTPREVPISGENFSPHISLVQSDLPLEPGIWEQGKALALYIYDTLPAREFEARNVQLIEFHSEEWAGAWWETLRYRQLRGWDLPLDEVIVS